MKILFNLTSDSELNCYESLSLAFVLASFDHLIQLRLDSAVLPVLTDSTSRFFGMIKSAPLYDLPPIWVDDLADFQDLPSEILALLIPTPADTLKNSDKFFDSVLVG